MTTKDEPILVTGAAGFIGFHLAQRLMQAGRTVVGLDNINDYYDPKLKEARLSILRNDPRFSFVKLDLTDRVGMKTLFSERGFPVVVHLAAQAGVRYSIDHPHAYADANLEGFTNILEGCPPRRLQASAVRVVIVGLRQQRQAAVLGARQCRSSDQPLCARRRRPMS